MEDYGNNRLPEKVLADFLDYFKRLDLRILLSESALRDSLTDALIFLRGGQWGKGSKITAWPRGFEVKISTENSAIS